MDPPPTSASRPRAPQANDFAASARVFASFFHANHRHVSKVREAVGSWLCSKQNELMQAMTGAANLAHRIAVVAVDETEFDLDVRRNILG